jgi:hypothetical protein
MSTMIWQLMTVILNSKLILVKGVILMNILKRTEIAGFV